MAVVPMDLDGVVAHRFDVQHLERWLVHLKRIAWRRRGIAALLWLGAVSAGAAGARTFVAQIGERVLAGMAVLPVDLNALGFGNGDMFGLGLGFNHWLLSAYAERASGGWCVACISGTRGDERW